VIIEINKRKKEKKVRLVGHYYANLYRFGKSRIHILVRPLFTPQTKRAGRLWEWKVQSVPICWNSVCSLSPESFTLNSWLRAHQST